LFSVSNTRIITLNGPSGGRRPASSKRRLDFTVQGTLTGKIDMALTFFNL